MTCTIFMHIVKRMVAPYSRTFQYQHLHLTLTSTSHGCSDWSIARSTPCTARGQNAVARQLSFSAAASAAWTRAVTARDTRSRMRDSTVFSAPALPAAARAFGRVTWGVCVNWLLVFICGCSTSLRVRVQFVVRVASTCPADTKAIGCPCALGYLSDITALFYMLASCFACPLEIQIECRISKFAPHLFVLPPRQSRPVAVSRM